MREGKDKADVVDRASAVMSWFATRLLGILEVMSGITTVCRREAIWGRLRRW